MPRKNFNPHTRRDDEKEIYRRQQDFGAGMVHDAPHSEIPDNSLALLKNVIAYPTYLQGRYGSRVYSERGLPHIEARAGLTGDQVGNILTSPDAAFTAADVSNYWVWDDGTNDEIVGYIGATQVRMRTSRTKSGTNCSIRGRLNSWYFHRGVRNIVMHIGTEVYVADDIAITNWTKVLCVSAEQPSSATSYMDDMDDYTMLFSSNGIYKIDSSATTPVMYRINTTTPAVYVTGNELTRTAELEYGRRYIYTMLRLDGNQILGDRATPRTILQESGPNQPDSDYKDWGEVWTELQRGDGVTLTHGVLTGTAVAAASQDPANVWAIVNDGTVNLTIDGTTKNIFVDFTDVQTMVEVASRIQISMREYWKDSTCEYTADEQFKITSGLVDNTSIAAAAAGTGGTDISGAGYMNLLTGTVENTKSFADPKLIGTFTVPLRTDSITLRAWHWSHYGVYVTKDVGINGFDPVTGGGNDPERYIWCYDLRIAGAFYATKDTNGVVTAAVGEFERADVGSVLEWDDGDRDVITAYISVTQVVVGGGRLYPEDVKTGACAIGNGLVFRGSQTGNTVTRIKGASFAAGDVRKTIFFADGSKSIITGYVDADTVRVHDSANKVLQGYTMDPQYRNFNDTITEANLDSRSGSWLLRNRFWSDLPLTNGGVVVPGFLFTFVRGEQNLYYCQLPRARKYLAGYYNAAHQLDTSAKDGIQHLAEFPNRVVIYCTNSTYAGPTNESRSEKTDRAGEVVVIFLGLQVMDSNIGVVDYGSIRYKDVGRQIMITNEPAVREFDGFQYGPNLAEDPKNGMERMMSWLRRWQNATASAYKDGEYIVWGLRK